MNYPLRHHPYGAISVRINPLKGRLVIFPSIVKNHHYEQDELIIGYYII